MMRKYKITIECTEKERDMIKHMRYVNDSENISDYLVSLVDMERTNYKEYQVFAVVKGINKKGTEYIEKRREYIDTTLLDKDTLRTGIKEYIRLKNLAIKRVGKIFERPNHVMYLECEGKELTTHYDSWYAYLKEIK